MAEQPGQPEEEPTRFEGRDDLLRMCALLDLDHTQIVEGSFEVSSDEHGSQVRWTGFMVVSDPVVSELLWGPREGS